MRVGRLLKRVRRMYVRGRIRWIQERVWRNKMRAGRLELREKEFSYVEQMLTTAIGDSTPVP